MTDSTEQKTEKPTPHKLREARKRGEVIRSQEVPGALTLLALAALFGFSAAFFWRHLQALVELPLEALQRGDALAQLPWLTAQLLREFVYLALPPTLLVLLMGIAGTYFQVGGLLSFEPIKPKLSHLNPVQGLKRLFSTHSLIELLKTLLKLLVIGVLIYLMVRATLGDAFKFAYLAPRAIGALSGKLFIHILVYAGLCYLILSFIDYAHQYYEFMKKQRMSKQELRREYKETEGDPTIKSTRRFLAREFAAEDIEELARSATVIVKDKAVAVALHYDAGSAVLPSVLIKGSGALAAKIIRAAQEAGVPVQHDQALARRLYAIASGTQISADLFDAVARVLALAPRPSGGRI